MVDETTTEDVYYQKAPYPTILRDLVNGLTYRKGWTVRLMTHLDRGQGSEGMTLVITTRGYDSYHTEDGENYRVNHYMPVPPAAYNKQSWQRWLLEQFLLVERHECMEFFQINGKRPYGPHHGPGHDPYNIFDHGTYADKRTMYTGKVLKPYKESNLQREEENAPQPSMDEIDDHRP